MVVTPGMCPNPILSSLWGWDHLSSQPFESTLWLFRHSFPSWLTTIWDNTVTCHLHFAPWPVSLSPPWCNLSVLCLASSLRSIGNNVKATLWGGKSVRHLYFASVSLTLYRRLAYLHHQLSSSARVTSVKSQQPLPVTDFQTPCVYLGPIKNIYTWPRSWVR